MLVTLSGIGYDVHQFAPDRKLVLGGVEIPCELGLAGHSDADVLCHALADAILGAVGLPDIGFYFPPGEASCKDISSLLIVKKACELAAAEGAKLVNVDCSLIAEMPKVLPHIKAMKACLASVTGLSEKRIGIKATTNESMGFVGRREGIAALAIASLLLEQ